MLFPLKMNTPVSLNRVSLGLFCNMKGKFLVYTRMPSVLGCSITQTQSPVTKNMLAFTSGPASLYCLKSASPGHLAVHSPRGVREACPGKQGMRSPSHQSPLLRQPQLQCVLLQVLYSVWLWILFKAPLSLVLEFSAPVICTHRLWSSDQSPAHSSKLLTAQGLQPAL